MSSNDPTPDHPAETPDPSSPPADEFILERPVDYQQIPPKDGERLNVPPNWQPELGLPTRPIAQKPRWPHPNFWWSLLWCIFFLLVTQVPGAIIIGIVAVVMMVLTPGQFPNGTRTTPAALMQTPQMAVGLAVGFFITELLVIGVSLLVIRLVVGRDWTRQLALRRPSLAHTLLTLVSLPALVLSSNVVYEVLRNVLHVPSFSDLGIGGMEEMTKVFSQWPWPFAVLVIGLGPGIGEELWCRGFLGRGLVGNYGVVLGVIFTSFFFGLIHVDPCQGTMAMLMGLWLHFVYLTTRSLWLPMLLHFLNNSLAVIAPRFPQMDFLDAKPSEVPLLVYGATVLVLGAVAYALYQSRARLEADTSQQIVSWRPAYKGVEYPPADSGTRVVHPAPSALALALAEGGFVLFVAACVAWIR